MGDKIHRIKIEQHHSQDWGSSDVPIETRYMTLKLIEKFTSPDLVTGFWRPTSQTFTGEKIEFSNVSSDGSDMRWRWRGGAWGGTLIIGVQSTSRSSHVESQNFHLFQMLVLTSVGRDAMRRFRVASVLEHGGGAFMYPVPPHFSAGPVLWTPYDYSYSYANE